MEIVFERDEVGFLISALRCARGCITERSNLTKEEELRAEKYKYLYEKIIERDKQEMYMRIASLCLNEDDLDQAKFDVVYKQLLENVPSTDPFLLRFRYIAMKKGYIKGEK